MKFIWIEIWKFIKNNFIKILIGITLFTGIFVFVTRKNYIKELENVQELTEDSVFEIDSAPAHFQFYIENTDDTIFMNNIIIEQYFTHPEVLKSASKNTKTMLADIVEKTENKAIVDYNSAGETKIIGVGKDGNSHLHEFYVNIGNESDNLKIANFYFDYFTIDNLPFLEGKEIFMFREPVIKNMGEVTTEVEKATSVTSNYDYMRYILLGMLFGGVVTLGILLLYAFLSKKIKYSFTYSLKTDDYFFLSDKSLKNDDQLVNLIDNSIEQPTVFITENIASTIPIFKEHKYSNINNYRSILEIPNVERVKRIVYVVEEDVTTREWYNNQRRLDSSYNIPTLVFQINNC